MVLIQETTCHTFSFSFSFKSNSQPYQSSNNTAYSPPQATNFSAPLTNPKPKSLHYKLKPTEHN
ncbi:hypothetical protein MtrunA17_Chr2g0304591 [Medicago truncatula]|uniref:Uncharacterized protein n=1 Tax=Medicago truncatula TaxID=3880 RepID=A0A396J7B9_MEDTR|nr:hypothetical protein MtrunA17_Chr2g0304591 [Medicago truncatula]